jgi:predicted transcriptional regulator
VSVRKSVTPNYFICFEDGKKFKSLRGHLAKHGMTPEQYREKWKLPSDYPMVAPTYAAARSELAKRAGLGRKRRPGWPPKGRQTVSIILGTLRARATQ